MTKHSKIDMRGVSIPRCPFQGDFSVQCQQKDSKYLPCVQYICVCLKDEKAPQSRGEHQ